jgi:hypothetical protein
MSVCDVSIFAVVSFMRLRRIKNIVEASPSHLIIVPNCPSEKSCESGIGNAVVYVLNF